MKRALFFVVIFSAAGALAQTPYYPGTYTPSDTGSNNPAPAAQPAPPPPETPSIVYRRAPVYRPVYRAAGWESLNDPALGPWPWNFDFGGGPTAITGSNHSLESGSNFVFGGGYNYSPSSGFVLEFMNSWLGVSDRVLQDNGAINGSGYIWSFTVNPVWRFPISGPVGGYLIGGGGYYERQMRFIEPVQVFVPTFGGGFFAPGLVTVRQTDDAGGLNGGAGITWNLGWGTKFFVEARYHYIFTSGHSTQLIPVTFGIRW